MHTMIRRLRQLERGDDEDRPPPPRVIVIRGGLLPGESRQETILPNGWIIRGGLPPTPEAA